MSAPAAGDPYVAFTRRFFARWSPLYDLFAKPIGFAYGAGVRLAGARPGRSILDLCTGTGEIALHSARRGARVTAVDLTPSMFLRAAQKTRGLPARVAREALVVLDYDFPRREPWRRAVLAGLASFETPYLREFAKRGAAGALAEAGLPIEETVRPLPGLFVVHRVG